MTDTDEAERRRRRDPRRILIEVGFFLLIFAYYQAGNYLWEVDVSPASPASIHDSPAHANAWKLWKFEEKVGLDFEKPTQDFFSQFPGLMWLLVFFYAGPHFVLTFGFLAWAYRYRFASFPYVRNAAVIFTVSAFSFEYLFPVAPPRLVTEFGMTDTVRELLPVDNGTPWINGMVNDYAGFPSVHTGWALLVAVLAIRLTTSPWRWLWLLYPAMIALSITATANHVTWDVVGAVAWVGLVDLAHLALQRKGWLPAPADVAWPALRGRGGLQPVPDEPQA